MSRYIILKGQLHAGKKGPKFRARSPPKLWRYPIHTQISYRIIGYNGNDAGYVGEGFKEKIM